MSLRVTGYDKQTERLSISHRVPEDVVALARDLAHVGANDDGEGAYPLDTTAAVTLSLRLEQKLNPDLYDWFLEPAPNA